MSTAQVILRAAQGARDEGVELHGQAWSLGSSSACDIQIAHHSVAPIHAELTLRRGRFLLRGTATGRVARAGARLQGPVVMAFGEGFQPGAVTVEVRTQPGPPIADLKPHAGRLGRLSTDRPFRCYDAEHGEVCWAPYAPPGVVGLGVGSGQIWYQPFPEGVRLKALLDRLQDASLGPPAELAVVFVAELGRGLVAHHKIFGPHGSLGPQSVHLGVRGEVSLMPAPLDIGPAIAWMSPERAHGGPPSLGDDAFAFASLSMNLLRACGAPTGIWGPLSRLLQVDPGRRNADIMAVVGHVRARAEAAGLDASAQHLARVVRLLAADQRELLLRL